MTSRALLVALVAVLGQLAPCAVPGQLAPRTARAQQAPKESYPARCGVGGGPDERDGYIPLPRGDVFCPLIADPKSFTSFAAYQHGTESDFPENIATIGIGDQFPFFRWAGKQSGNGLQLGLEGAVLAQFHFADPTYELLNADYLIALPLTFRAQAFSARARAYHQSSHLGDEFLLLPNPPLRENLSFEAAELLLSVDVHALRLYGGGEFFFRREPADIPDALAHGGAELRPPGALNLGAVAAVRVIAGVDVKVVNDTVTRTGISARAGFEVGRPNAPEARRWSVLGEFYDGPSPYGQFHRQKVRFMGVGVHFSP